MIQGYYYLHENGDLIYKREHVDDWDDPRLPTLRGLRESDLVRAIWPFDPSDRAGVWTILVESMAAGAKRDRVLELASKWQCDNADALIYAKHVGIKVQIDHPSRPDDWFATLPNFVDLMRSPSGWGSTALEAIAELAKAVGYVPRKVWGEPFAQIVSRLSDADVAGDPRS